MSILDLCDQNITDSGKLSNGDFLLKINDLNTEDCDWDDFEDHILVIKSSNMIVDIGPNLTDLIKEITKKRFMGSAADNLENTLLKVLKVIFPQVK
ncbi:hypothetical protein GUI12_02955 [Anaplasmataceae bacterium AB001_6]|nr:hypothetical protein GUI12_02955 [Anaplasmataceae bacterium AB001_6]